MIGPFIVYGEEYHFTKEITNDTSLVIKELLQNDTAGNIW